MVCYQRLSMTFVQLYILKCSKNKRSSLVREIELTTCTTQKGSSLQVKYELCLINVVLWVDQSWSFSSSHSTVMFLEQTEPGGQTEQAPPSGVLRLSPSDMAGFKFLSVSVAPRPVWWTGPPHSFGLIAIGEHDWITGVDLIVLLWFCMKIIFGCWVYILNTINMDFFTQHDPPVEAVLYVCI